MWYQMIGAIVATHLKDKGKIMRKMATQFEIACGWSKHYTWEMNENQLLHPGKNLSNKFYLQTLFLSSINLNFQD